MKTLTIIVLLVVLLPEARAIDVVVPGANASTDGNTGNILPFANGTLFRYQQVYGASEFGSIPISGYIDHVAFRLDSGFRDPNTTPISYLLRIDLSTTTRPVDGLSTTFSDNVGADNATVFSATYVLPVLTHIAGAPQPFDMMIPFTRPFLYDPSDGNLLLDITCSGGAQTGEPYLDAVISSADSVSRVRAFGFSLPVPLTGQADTFGLVTQFEITPVPEPSVGALAILGVSILLVMQLGPWSRRHSAILQRRCP